MRHCRYPGRKQKHLIFSLFLLLISSNNVTRCSFWIPNLLSWCRSVWDWVSLPLVWWGCLCLGALAFFLRLPWSSRCWGSTASSGGRRKKCWEQSFFLSCYWFRIGKLDGDGFLVGFRMLKFNFAWRFKSKKLGEFFIDILSLEKVQDWRCFIYVPRIKGSGTIGTSDIQVKKLIFRQQIRVIWWSNLNNFIDPLWGERLVLIVHDPGRIGSEDFDIVIFIQCQVEDDEND